MNTAPPSNPRPPQVDFRLSEEGWLGYGDFLRGLIREHGAKRIGELGGGANPALPLDYVREQGLSYVLADISPEELAKAPPGYATRVLDMTAREAGTDGEFDFVFSRMLAEHVSDPVQFHTNVRRMLKPGGVAFHFFPTLYAPPFVLNLMVPEALSSWLLNRLQPGRESSGNHGKFVAYYRWCRGPSAPQIARLESVGFRVLRYTGFFGHKPYYRKFPPLLALHSRLAEWLCRHPWPRLTSFAYVVLQKTAS